MDSNLMSCPTCGHSVNSIAGACNYCGAIVEDNGPPPQAENKATGEKAQVIASPPPLPNQQTHPSEEMPDEASENALASPDQPESDTARSLDEALKIAKRIGYPLMVRPSFVLGGRGMEIVYDEEMLVRYAKESLKVSPEHPMLIDRFLENAVELEVDALSDGKDTFVASIMEHIELAGVHSGDSACAIPTHTIKKEHLETIEDYTAKIAKELKVVGLMNIQYVYDGNEVYVIEVNPRASRTVPILSKVTGVPMVKLAVEIATGKKLKDLGYGIGLKRDNKLYAVKVPVFSNEKLANVDTYLGPEMRSTGEVMGVDKDFDMAIYKGFRAAGYSIPTSGNLYVSVKDVDKKESIALIKEYSEIGYKIYASAGTGKYLNKNGITSEIITYNELMKFIDDSKINLIINAPTKGNVVGTTGFKIRRKAAVYRVPVFTCIDTAKAFITAIKVKKENREIKYVPMKEYFK